MGKEENWKRLLPFFCKDKTGRECKFKTNWVWQKNFFLAKGTEERKKEKKLIWIEDKKGKRRRRTNMQIDLKEFDWIN